MIGGKSAGPMLAAALTAAAIGLGAAQPAAAQPVWRLDALSNTTVAAGGTLDYVVNATNTGEAGTDGSEIDITAALPQHMTAVSAEVDVPDFGVFDTFPCTAGDGSSPVAGAQTVKCANTFMLPRVGNEDYEQLRLTVAVDAGAAGSLTSSFGVSGGGAGSAASTVSVVRVASEAPGFGMSAFDGQAFDDAGNPYDQAGGVPASQSVTVDFNAATNPLYGPIWPVEPVKDVRVDVPPGLVGNPTVADTCSNAQLTNAVGPVSQPLCPATSQVGTALVRVNAGSSNTATTDWIGPVPVFNMDPPPNEPAQFGFAVLGSVVTLDATVRSGGDYGVTITSANIPEGLVLLGTTMTLWGTPASSIHDADRACPGNVGPYLGGPTCPSSAPPRAFLRNPTSCAQPGHGLEWTATADSWIHPGLMQPARFTTHLPPGFPAGPDDWGAQQGPEGCDRVPFTPRFDATPESSQAASPTGFSFDITLPQTDDPTQIGESDLRKAVVTLPQGMHVTPSSATGLAACAPEQIRLNDGSVPSCPDASKLGSVTIDTPLLRRPLTGGVYLAAPNDNPFGTLLALYVVAQGSGVVVKLAGEVQADPVTGQLTTTFDNAPQTPFSRLHLHFDGGPRAALTLPNACGPLTAHAELTGWNGRVVDADSAFSVDSGATGGACAAPGFSPSFHAETTRPVAGADSTFNLALARGDQDQEMNALTVRLPPGLTAKIANAVLCADAQAAAGTCPSGTKVGDVTVGAGAGPDPFYITNGQAFLTGPYKGAPFGLSIVAPAVAGPFDLGNVVVRSALFVDKHDASVRVVSDPFPTILQGIPLDVRDLRVAVDRPRFMVNPTSCAVKSVTGVVQSAGGATANVSDRFQVGECANLAFKPSMALAVGGKRHTGTGQPTPLTTRITMPAGDANLRYVRVTLPRTINARLTVINDACTRAEFENDIGKCAHAQAGTAVAVTPLLRDPLRGKVYFVKNGHALPDLFVALRGQVSFDLIGRITIVNSTFLRTTFDAAPDVPIRSFTLRLFGDSRHGSIGGATNLCAAKARKATASLTFIGQNGRRIDVRRALVVHGCPKPRKAARHRRR